MRFAINGLAIAQLLTMSINAAAIQPHRYIPSRPNHARPNHHKPTGKYVPGGEHRNCGHWGINPRRAGKPKHVYDLAGH